MTLSMFDGSSLGYCLCLLSMPLNNIVYVYWTHPLDRVVNVSTEDNEYAYFTRFLENIVFVYWTYPVGNIR